MRPGQEEKTDTKRNAEEVPCVRCARRKNQLQHRTSLLFGLLPELVVLSDLLGADLEVVGVVAAVVHQRLVAEINAVGHHLVHIQDVWEREINVE